VKQEPPVSTATTQVASNASSSPVAGSAADPQTIQKLIAGVKEYKEKWQNEAAKAIELENKFKKLIEAVKEERAAKAKVCILQIQSKKKSLRMH
jgi:hypothetical protein